jgi:hypothetical protein
VGNRVIGGLRLKRLVQRSHSRLKIVENLAGGRPIRFLGNEVPATVNVLHSTKWGSFLMSLEIS